MFARHAAWLAAAVLASVALARAQTQESPRVPAAEARAVAYLVEEVPRWRREHPCYSCHNNGDATRALLAAAGTGHDVGTALDDTMIWLATPERWEQNARRGGSEELPLARIHFSSALAAMVDARRADRGSLDRAAALLVPHQQTDGSWQLNPSQILGGATFYGTALATASARGVLARASSAAARAATVRADRWLRTTELQTVLDASSVLIGLGRDGDAGAAAQRARALGLLARGQAPDGGWGPYVNSPSEVFDTALAVLALVRTGADGWTGSPLAGSAGRDAIGRARTYLAAAQTGDGSWVETTRPSGGESYAQRVSTTAWALLALLESR